jgi:hypothetical protein
VIDTVKNANSPGMKKGDARQVVFFSQIQWQTSNPREANFAAGWRSDVLVGNPYSFQLIVSGGNLADGLILRDVASNKEIQATAPRVNQSFDCGSSVGAPAGKVLCYWNPGQSLFVQRPTLPTNSPAYSVELVQTCGGILQYKDLRCPVSSTNPNGPQKSTDVVTVLTISPPVSPSIPAHGQKFVYDLVSRNANGEQATRITAVYVAPDQCKIDNLLLSPNVVSPNPGNAGDLIDVKLFIRACYQASIFTDDPNVPQLDFWTVSSPDSASEPSVTRDIPYVLPKIETIHFTAKAYDAMDHEVSTDRTAQVSPCSVNPTAQDCATRCSANPPASDCPNAHPVCAVGQGDSNRKPLQFTFTILCSGSDTTHQETDYGCTQADALTAAKNRWQGSNCGPVGMGTMSSPDGGTTPTPPECGNGASKQDWKVCLACGTNNSDLTIKACTFQDAQSQAALNCPNNLAVVTDGECP